MKIDTRTYKDRKEMHRGMTTDHTFRLDKVLFFADPHFLVFKSRPTFHTIGSRTSQHTNKNLPKREILPTHTSNLIRIVINSN